MYMMAHPMLTVPKTREHCGVTIQLYAKDSTDLQINESRDENQGCIRLLD